MRQPEQVRRTEVRWTRRPLSSRRDPWQVGSQLTLSRGGQSLRPRKPCLSRHNDLHAHDFRDVSPLSVHGDHRECFREAEGETGAITERQSARPCSVAQGSGQIGQILMEWSHREAEPCQELAGGIPRSDSLAATSERFTDETMPAS